MIAVHLRGAYLVDAARVAGDVRARLRRNSKYFEPVREVSLRMGIALCRGEGGHARIDTRHRRRSSPQRRARERDLPRTRHGNENVKGFRAKRSRNAWAFQKKSS